MGGNYDRELYFNAYYALGAIRSLDKLHQTCTEKPLEINGRVPSRRVLGKWSIEDKWQERILLKSREVAQETQKRMVNEEVSIRVAAHKIVMKARDMLLMGVGSAFYINPEDNKKKLKPEVEVNSAREFKDLLLAVVRCEEIGLNILAPEEEIKLKHTGTIELTTPQLDPTIAKEAAKLITKMQSEQSIAKRAKT